MISRARLRALCVLVTFLLSLPSWSPGRAAEQSIVVLVRSDSLLRALRIALASWGVDVRMASRPLLPHTAEEAARVAREQGAAALVWSDPQAASALHVYDGERHELSTLNAQGRAPWSDEAAAGIALSVKTALRNTSMAARAQQAAPEPMPADEPAALVAPAAPSTPAPDVHAAPALEAAATSAAPPRLPRLALALGAGVRSRPTLNTRPRARYELALAAYEPWWTRGKLGLALSGALTHKTPFATQLGRGRLSEFWIGVGPRGLIPLMRTLQLELALDYELQRTHVEGRDRDARAFAASRLNHALGFALALELHVTRYLFLVPRFGVHRVLRPQRYRIGSEQLLEIAQLALEGTLRVGVELL